MPDTDLSQKDRSGAVKLVGADASGGETEFAQVDLDLDGNRRLLVKVAGVVDVTPAGVSDLFVENALNGASSAMNINGSITPVDFLIGTHATQDKYVTELRFYANPSNMTFENFLGFAAPLVNGILVSVKAENKSFSFPLILTTSDFDSKFALSQGRFFVQQNPTGNTTSMLAQFLLVNPFILKKTGTYGTNDFIKVRIKDDLSTGTRARDLGFIASGFRK